MGCHFILTVIARVQEYALYMGCHFILTVSARVQEYAL